MSTKAKRAENQAPETLLWAMSFDYEITLPMDECVARLQQRLGNRTSFISTDEEVVQFSIHKPNKGLIMAWATGELDIVEDDVTGVFVVVGIDPEIIFLFLPVAVGLLLGLWGFSQSILAGLLCAGLVTAVCFVIYSGAKSERENLLLEFEETLE